MWIKKILNIVIAIIYCAGNQFIWKHPKTTVFYIRGYKSSIKIKKIMWKTVTVFIKNTLLCFSVRELRIQMNTSKIKNCYWPMPKPNFAATI